MMNVTTPRYSSFITHHYSSLITHHSSFRMNNDRTLIVVPTYNERENVARLVGELLAVAPGADVCLIDDASPDGTAGHAEGLYGREPRFSVLRRAGARGYGRSLVDGYRRALEGGYARLVQLDADLSHDPRSEEHTSELQSRQYLV